MNNVKYGMQIGMYKLPILPENLKEMIVADNQHYDTLQGERVSKGDVKLHTWTISSYFPIDGEISPRVYKEYYEGEIANKNIDKEGIIFFIDRWIDQDTLVFETNTNVLIESIEWEDRQGEPGDLYYTIKLVQYKEFGSKVIK